MPRMTICRSSLTTLAALAAATPAAGAQAPRAEAHTVQSGDTLWQLARRYLGDPFLWPQIYRLNTGVVEDPHWIYPGEVLQLAASEGVQSVPSEDTPAPRGRRCRAAADSGAASGTGGGSAARRRSTRCRSSPARSGGESSDGLSSYINQEYRPLRPGEFYSSGFLTEDQTLPAGIMLGPVTPPQIRNLSERSMATIFNEVGIRAPEGATYAKGDTLTVVRHRAGFPGLRRHRDSDRADADNRPVRESVPGRRGRASSARSGAASAVMPTEKFTARPDDPSRPKLGHPDRAGCWAGREIRELKHPQNRLLIDLGRAAGVAPGDIFEIRRTPGSAGQRGGRDRRADGDRAGRPGWRAERHDPAAARGFPGHSPGDEGSPSRQATQLRHAAETAGRAEREPARAESRPQVSRLCSLETSSLETSRRW